MSRLQTYYHLTYMRQVINPWPPSTARTISSKAGNFPVEYPNREYSHDIKEFECNMFNPIFKENVHGWKHSKSCAFTKPELRSYRKPKRVVQNEKNGNNSHNYHDENHGEIEIKGTHNDTQHQNSAHPKNSPIDCGGVQLTNA